MSLTLCDLIYDLSFNCDIIRTDSDSDWFRVYVYDKLALEMTIEDYFNTEFDDEMLYELLNTAMRAGQESINIEER
jgi:hypothetical protein|nr:MAG TPA: hypothetical protein [Caudoviricetes sp.]